MPLPFTRRGIDPDAADFCSRSGASDRAAVSAFVRGVKDLGLYQSMVCWPLRSTQNAGTGTTAYSLGGLGTFNGTLIAGPTWGADGIRSADGGSTRYIQTASFAQPATCTFVAVFDDQQSSPIPAFLEVAGRFAESAFGLAFTASSLRIAANDAFAATLSKPAGKHFVTARTTSGAQDIKRNASDTASGTASGTFGASVTFKMASSNYDPAGTGYLEQAFAAIISGTVDHETLRSLYKNTLGQGLGLP
jgi:hypothetical protein